MKKIGSLHEFADKRCIFSAAFPSEILLYHDFEDTVNPHDYLNEQNKIFEKYDCLEKFLWLPLKIYSCYVFNFYIKFFTKKKIKNKEIIWKNFKLNMI